MPFRLCTSALEIVIFLIFLAWPMSSKLRSTTLSLKTTDSKEDSFQISDGIVFTSPKPARSIDFTPSFLSDPSTHVTPS